MNNPQDAASQSWEQEQRNFRKRDRKNLDPYKHFDLGGRFQGSCLSNWHVNEQMLNVVHGWMKNPKGFLNFLGCTGAGKTFLCASLLNYFWESGEEIWYISCRRFIQKIQYAIGENQNQYYEIQKISEQKILIFDDLGSSTNTDWQKEMILDLVDRRYESRLPTVFTSNFSEEMIKKELGFRTHSRMINTKGHITIQKWDADLRSQYE